MVGFAWIAPLTEDVDGGLAAKVAGPLLAFHSVDVPTHEHGDGHQNTPQRGLQPIGARRPRHSSIVKGLTLPPHLRKLQISVLSCQQNAARNEVYYA